MAAQARTLLAKLGFADADRKSPRHDLACNYLALRPGVLRSALSLAVPKNIEVVSARGELEFQVLKGEGKYSTTVGFVDVLARFVAGSRVRVREPAQAGDPRARDGIQDNPTTSVVVARAFQAVVEVKIAPCSVGDLIRQLRVYNEHVPHLIGEDVPHTMPGSWCDHIDGQSKGWNCQDSQTRWLLDLCSDERQRLIRLRRLTIAALDFDIDAEYARALRSVGVTPIRLGSGFEEFLATRNLVTDVRDEVPEL